MGKFYLTAQEPAKIFKATRYCALESLQIGAVLTISFAWAIVIKSLF
jgi:hypothetical protein